MHDSPLEGVSWKLRRAIDHLRDIDVAVGEMYLLKDAKTAGHKVDKDRTELIITYPYQPPLDPRFSMMVGDCIHNTRSALDHLVAQLAILHRASARAIELTAFPVCLTAEKFKEATDRKVAPHISGDALTEIERLQPYSTGDGENDILWVLSKLDIIDKHRLLLVAKDKVRVRGIDVTTRDGQKFARHDFVESPWKSPENGAELIRFKFPQPMPEMHVKVDTEGTIQLEQSGLICDGRNLMIVLRDSIEYVGWIVSRFHDLFFVK
jgi:hypothetical protein